MHRNTCAMTLALALILGASCWALPYFQSNNNNQQKPSDKDKKKQSDKDKDKDKKNEESPFGSGKINLLKSSQKSDAASAGFNGLTPNGEVEAKKLKEPVTADDLNKAAQLSSISVKAISLKKFIQEGKLNTAPAKAETTPKKGL